MSIIWKGRAALNSIKLYSPGVNKKSESKKIFKMASNESPLGPSPKAIAGIKSYIENIHVYPDMESTSLKEGISELFNVSLNEIIIGNGSDEIIKLISESFIDKEDEILMGDPSFSEYEFAGKLMHGQIKKVPLVNFTHNLSDFLNNITPKTKMIFICNPNNPTGTIVGKEEILNFLKSVPKHIIVVVDEAYGEYGTGDFYSVIPHIKEFNNLIVLKTFSKLFGLAALRVGYGLGNEDLISWIRKVKEPFNVNGVAQVGALCALSDSEYISTSLEVNEIGKKFIMESFEEMGIEYSPSQTNFIWFDGKLNSNLIFEKLLKEGIIIRNGASFGYDTYLRVTIGQMEENRLFIDSLRKIYYENKSPE